MKITLENGTVLECEVANENHNSPNYLTSILPNIPAELGTYCLTVKVELGKRTYKWMPTVGAC